MHAQTRTQTQTHAASPSSSAARLTAASVRRRADLKPSLMSHISGVHRLSAGADGLAGSVAQAAAKPLPKYGVDCTDKAQLDEVHNSLRQGCI